MDEEEAEMFAKARTRELDKFDSLQSELQETKRRTELEEEKIATLEAANERVRREIETLKQKISQKAAAQPL